MPEHTTGYFFSYTRSDSEFALKLAKELRQSGAKLWLDQLDIKGGERWDRTVETALVNSQGVLVILTPESVNSANVMDEVSYALEEGKLVIPILWRECQIPFRLRRVQYIDFTGEYKTGFDRLLLAMQIEPVSVTFEGNKIEIAEESAQDIQPETIPEQDMPVQGKTAEHKITAANENIEEKEKETPEKKDITLSGHQPAGQKRTRAIIIGAAAGTIVGMLAMATIKDNIPAMIYLWGLVTGLGGAIAGAVCSTDKRKIRLTIIVAVLGWIIAMIIIDEKGRFAIGAIFGASPGLILGSILAAIIYKKKTH